MVINKWKKYILPVISAGLIYGACHINDIKKAYNTYFQKPYHEFVSENEFIPDGTQFYDLSDYRQTLLGLAEGINNNDIDTLSDVKSIDNKKDFVLVELVRKEYMPMERAKKYVDKLPEDELNKLWRRYMKHFLSIMPENRILRVKFKCEGDDEVKRCNVKAYLESGVNDIEITLINKDGKWVEK